MPEQQPEVESEVQRQADRLDETQVQGAGTRPASGSSRECSDDGTRAQTYVAQPIGLSRTPARIATHPPAIGEHSAAIMREAGLADDEIADLKSRQVI